MPNCRYFSSIVPQFWSFWWSLQFVTIIHMWFNICVEHSTDKIDFSTIKCLENPSKLPFFIYKDCNSKRLDTSLDIKTWFLKASMPVLISRLEYSKVWISILIAKTSLAYHWCGEPKFLCVLQINQRKMVKIIKFSACYDVFLALITSCRVFVGL